MSQNVFPNIFNNSEDRNRYLMYCFHLNSMFKKHTKRRFLLIENIKNSLSKTNQNNKLIRDQTGKFLDYIFVTKKYPEL